MTTGVMPLEDFKPQLVANTAFFETSQTVYPNAYGITSGNWDTAGMSLGALQINFGAANRLSPYFQYMINNYDSFCNGLWLNNGLTQTDYNNWKTLMLGNDLTAKHDWGDSISNPAVGKNGQPKGDLNAPYVEIFRQMGIHEASIAKQVEISETNYMPSAFKIFNQMSCNSRLSLASFYDLNINRGRCWPLNLIQADFDSIDANNSIDATEKERQKIYQINWRGCFDNNETTNGARDRWDTSDGTGGYAGRRKLMADQAGSYFGSIYDPEGSFQMTQDIAIEEKAAKGVKVGTNPSKTYLGGTEIDKAYFGDEIIYSKPYKTGEAPQTRYRKLTNDYTGIPSGGSVSMAAGDKLWIDVLNWIACRTYYTKDGSTPTTASTLYTDALTFDASCTLKTLTVSSEGIVEAVKTLTVTVASNLPVTTISPAATVQNSIPITFTLSATNSPTAIYYKIGTGAQQTYTGPVSVNQNTAGVNGTTITIHYWSVNANGTEAENIINYDTSGAQPTTPVLTATPGNNKVDLSWTAATNATAYTLYRSTTSGQLGSFIGTQFMTMAQTTYSDTTALNDTTYYYTVVAGNYGALKGTSVQKSATPVAAVSGYRYIRIDGYGEYYSGAGYTNSRMIEVEIFSGGVNVLASPTKLAASTDDTVDTGAEVGSTTPTRINDGVKTIASNSYNIWWSDITLNGNAGNGWVKFDLGSAKTIDSIRYWGYTSRAPRFKIWGTNNLADFGTNGAHGNATLLWDMSANNGTTLAGATAGTNNYVEKIGGF